MEQQKQDRIRLTTDGSACELVKGKDVPTRDAARTESRERAGHTENGKIVD
jgi:hypothetical protein